MKTMKKVCSILVSVCVCVLCVVSVCCVLCLCSSCVPLVCVERSWVQLCFPVFLVPTATFVRDSHTVQKVFATKKCDAICCLFSSYSSQLPHSNNFTLQTLGSFHTFPGVKPEHASVSEGERK